MSKLFDANVTFLEKYFSFYFFYENWEISEKNSEKDLRKIIVCLPISSTKNYNFILFSSF